MSQIFLGSFHGNATGRQNQSDAFLNHLTVSGKSVLQCTTLTASQTVSADDVRCKTAVLGGLSVSGAAEICDIQCPNNFLLSAQENVRIEAGDNAIMVSNTGPVFLLAGAQGPTATSNLSLLSNGSANLRAKTTTTVQASEGQLLLECQDTGQATGLSSCVSISGHLNSRTTTAAPNYVPTVDTTNWTGLVSLPGAPTDTAGKIQLDNNAAVAGDELRLFFGTVYAQAPVVQISIQGPVSATQSLPIISLKAISNNSFTLRLDVAATGIRNDIIQYTVIGMD